MNDIAISRPVGLVDLDTPRRIHIVGIGGAGMSAIATLLMSMGHSVSGSDIKASRYTERLESLGVRVSIGHRPGHVEGVDLVATSMAVRESNPEVKAARELGIEVVPRLDILAAITQRWKTVAVAGTHGKTTTSSMLAMALVGAGLDPSWLVGGELNEPGANASRGAGELLVCEADESDASFLHLGAYAVLVTNVEPDHMERYGESLDTLLSAFQEFLRQADGPRVVCVDDPGARDASEGLEVATYGLGEDARYRAVEVDEGRWGSSWTLVVDGTDLGRQEIALPGLHNVRNALGATAMALELGADHDGIQSGLVRFRGVRRRYEERATAGGVTFVDDYAHLPTEVAATIDTARHGGWNRVVAVFQPHLYSRTSRHAEAFGTALSRADLVFVTDVFAAREDPVPGVTGALVAEAVARSGTETRYVEHRGELARRVAAELVDGDLCLSLGAGDITILADEVVEALARDAWADPVDACAQSLAGVLAVPPQRDMPLAPMTTYKVGGVAAIFVEPESDEELLAVRDTVHRFHLPILVMGRGSNMLVSDLGFHGVALRLGAGFNWIEYEGTTVRAGGATPLPFLARSVGRHGLTGLEFGVGIPASVGGAVRMNAGGHGSEITNVLTHAGVVDLSASVAGVTERTAQSLGMSYRTTGLAPDEIVVWAEFELESGDRTEIEASMADIVRWRKENQPAGQSAGSVFKNPRGGSAGRLIDSAGCKGIRVGGAFVSPKHANFVMAEPWAKASDVFGVICEVRDRVRAEHGITLETEVRLVGEFEELDR